MWKYNYCETEDLIHQPLFEKSVTCITNIYVWHNKGIATNVFLLIICPCGDLREKDRECVKFLIYFLFTIFLPNRIVYSARN